MTFHPTGDATAETASHSSANTLPGKPVGKNTAPRLALALLGGGALAAVAILATLATLACAQAQDGVGPAAQQSASANGAAPGTTAAPTSASPPAVKVQGPNVRIVFKVIPPNRATVTWGKKKLGLIKPRAPLVVERPRDSGPLDVVVRADGCLPVHSRVYTFTDTTLAVRVTPVDKKNTLYGYREDLPPEADGGVAATGAGNPDGGVPVPVPPPPAPPAGSP